MMGTLSDVYEQDFYAWLVQNAQLLRQGRFSEIDIENLVEELETMGRSEKRELLHRLSVLLVHLLKWLVQVELRSKSWRYTIKEQRKSVADLLEENPSLRHELEDKLAKAYTNAVLTAAHETGLAKTRFPKRCPFSFAQLLDENFWPS